MDGVTTSETTLVETLRELDREWQADRPHDGQPRPRSYYGVAADRVAELEARISALIAGSILPADGADEITVDGVRWVRVPAEATVRFERH